MKAFLLLTALGTTAVLGTRSQDPQRPATEAQTEAASAASLEDLSWLAGVWFREQGTDVLEETWGAPIGDAMVGMFRWAKKGHTGLYELMSIEAESGKLVFRLRHFDRGLKPWKSEADGPLTYPLARIGEQEVVFENPERNEPRRFVYRRNGDSLEIRLEPAEGKAMEFRFQRRPPS